MTTLNIEFPYQFDGRGRSAEAATADYVKQLVEQTLFTSPGERVNLPQFGCGLRALVFAPITDALAATVQLRVLQSLDQWLAGIVTVSEVSVLTASQNSALAPGTIQVTVAYTIVDTQVPASATVILP